MSRYADPDCDLCGGSGFIYPKKLLDGGRSCECVQKRHTLVAMHRAWPCLIPARSFPHGGNLLKEYSDSNLWVTAPTVRFQGALKEAWFHHGPHWDVKIIQDAQILESWFSVAKAEGVEILDLEVEEAMISAIDVRSLVEPPRLAIIIMGIKQLKNVECPNALLEALHYRSHAGKPTWICDQPTQKLEFGHKFYSELVGEFISPWEHISLDETLELPRSPARQVAPPMITEPQEHQAPKKKKVEELPTPSPENSEGEGSTRNLLSSLSQDEDRGFTKKTKPKKKWKT